LPRIDQFESAFQSASKALFHHRHLPFTKVLVLTDMEPGPSKAWCSLVRGFLEALTSATPTAWRTVPGAECVSVGDVLELVHDEKPDLVCTYRNLHSSAFAWPHSLSDHLEVLTQVSPCSVLLLPRPGPDGHTDLSDGGPRNVMALTDHLSGDDSLVNHSVAFAAAGGTLHLTHVEDSAVFERYIEVIGKIPGLDTDLARRLIMEQLLKEPADYIRSCIEVLEKAGVSISITAEVTSGHRLSRYKELVVNHAVDLLVLHTRDDDQLAMNGMSYPLAVELRDTPMLML
jgi:hypothetical protein